jgi:hypothetical protein
MNKLLSLLALGLLPACPEQVGQQCPPHTLPVGQYTLTFASQDAGNQCAVAQPDGGTPKPLVLQGQNGATFCLGSGVDGGPQLSLLVTAKQGPRLSDLRPDAGFHFTGSNPATLGSTACACAVAIDESFDGYLQTTPPGPIALEADGGLPLITGLVGTFTDTLSTPAGTSGCLCTLPCTVTSSVTGTRF